MLYHCGNQNPGGRKIRFIIISVLPDPIADAVRGVQEAMARRTGASECLRYPVHLTLRTGLVCPDGEAELAAADFLRHASAFPIVKAWAESIRCSTYVDAKGVSRGFLGYGIHASVELLELHRHLLGYRDWMKGPQGTFEPHISLCYHDVSPEAAIELHDEFKPVLENRYPAWDIDRISLWNETSTGWAEYGSIPLRVRA